MTDLTFLSATHADKQVEFDHQADDLFAAQQKSVNKIYDALKKKEYLNKKGAENTIQEIKNLLPEYDFTELEPSSAKKASLLHHIANKVFKGSDMSDDAFDPGILKTS